MDLPLLDLVKQVLMPEFFVVAGIILALLLSVSSKAKYVWLTSAISLLAAVTHLLTVQLPATLEHSTDKVGPINILFDTFVFDSLSVYFRILIYVITLLITLASAKYMTSVESPAEYYSILLTAALGGSFLTGANDFLVLFVALETLGLSSILLASYARKSQASNEAGIKYLLSSAVATAMILLAISFVYGLTGATNFIDVADILYGLNASALVSDYVQIMISLLLVGAIAFKLSAVPFHNWSPDVYSGAPTTTTLFLSVVSKTAAFALAIRLFTSVIHSDLITLLISIAAIASILVGNYVGIVQVINRSSIKRLLAYSSIAQSGYLMVGLAILQEASLSALVFYLTIYAVMNTGAFLAAIYFEQEAKTDEIYELAGLIQKKPVTTVGFALCLINLAGLPFIPAGFIGKFFLFASAYSANLMFGTINLGQILAVVGLLGSVLALYYYLYLVKIMVVDSPSSSVRGLSSVKSDNSTFVAVMQDNAVQVALGLTVAAMIYIGVFNTGFFESLSRYVVKGIGL